MSEILVRRVGDTWKRRLMDGELTPDMKILPAWALGAFAPTEAEESDISIYVLPDAGSVIDLAAAWYATLEKAAASVWAILPAADASSKGLVWTLDNEGTTASPLANAWHAALSVGDAVELDRVVRAFAGGDIQSCELKSTDAALERNVRCDRISLVAPSKNKSGSNPFKKVPGWLADGWLTVEGRPKSETSAGPTLSNEDGPGV